MTSSADCPGSIRVGSIAGDYTNAWNTGQPEQVAAFFGPEAEITINGGEPWCGRHGVAEMAAGFFSDVPDMQLVCVNHAVYL